MKLPAVLLACTPLVFAGCGKEGPPLPPLNLVPAAAGEALARRIESHVELRFVLPTRNQNGPGPVDLEKVEIFAISVTPGTTPTNRDLMSKERLVGTIDVKPVPEEGEPAAETPSDKRPAPGDRVTFTEELTPEKMTPEKTAPEKLAEEKGTPPPDRAAVKEPTPAPPEGPPQRIYAIRGVSRGGRAGPPAPRLAVPLVPTPPVPGGLGVQITERALVVSWLPAVAEPASAARRLPAADPIAFNVYASATAAAPLNAAPLADPRFEHAPVRFDVEQCFVVRTVRTIQSVTIESAPSERACVSPRDTFAPAAPRGLTAVAGPDGISLSWDSNADEDLGGYIVLRGEAPDETLQALTGPIRETNFRDTAVKAGVAYVYRLVAVDKATPPNTSAQSEPARVTAR